MTRHAPRRAAARRTTITGPDGTARCAWCAGNPLYAAYHDEEWGRPVHDEVRIYEKLCLEGFQSGLSWLTILRKREAFRIAFRDFDPATVARYGARDVERLLRDRDIVRNRLKIEATIANARAVLAMRDSGRSLADVLWSHAPARTRSAPRRHGDVPSQTAESRALARELAGLGFRFVGPTTAYAAMQSLGVVNDHFATCDLRADAERSRRGPRPGAAAGAQRSKR
ncbi:MAG: hypothetical protein RL283_1411 [Actinomycetota bacterium]